MILKKYFTIVYEDEYLLIVNKKNNVVSSPNKRCKTNNLTNYVKQYLEKTSESFQVNRIDKQTTGLVIFSKNKVAYKKLKKLLKRKKIKKIYLAIIENPLKYKNIIIDIPIMHKKNEYCKMIVSKSIDSIEAITKVSLVKELNGNYSLVKCQILTGITHQIRAHLKYLNNPIYNDPVYNINKPENNGFSSFGQFLHSWKLIFTHPITKKKLKIVCPVPLEFDIFVKNITNI